MDIRDWVVVLVEPNRFEAQIVVDLLRFSGAQQIKIVQDSGEALTLLHHYPANIVLMELDSPPIDGLAWTRRLRRDAQSRGRKASVLMLTKAMSRAVAEGCRLAGVNGLIGKPVSGASLINTIKKVLASPRPFIEAENYVGPCRRAGIITDGAPLRRRQTDAEKAADARDLQTLVRNMRKCVEDLVTGKQTRVAPCEAGLREVQQIAVNSGDGPLMCACAAFSLQLSASEKLDGLGRAALGVCMDGLTKLVAPDIDEADREAIAESVGEAVSRAATSEAA